MSWENFYLVCFIVGFALSLVSFVGQFLHFGGLGHHAGHGPHLGHGGHGAGGHPAGGKLHLSHGHPGAPGKFNYMTATAFLAWFGGAGYLLEKYSSVVVWLAFALAMAAGLAGASFIYSILRSLTERDFTMNPEEYDVAGLLGQVTSPVREAGTGAMVYTRNGARGSVAIRSDSGEAISKGEEVVVVRYEKGIAYVRRWADLAQEQ